MGVKVEISDAFHKKMDDVKIRLALQKAMTETVIELRDTLAQDPTPKKTGNLRRSNTYEVRTSGSAIEGVVRNHAPYWVYVNFGTSKMDGVNFVGQAVDKVQPASKLQQYFESLYNP